MRKRRPPGAAEESFWRRLFKTLLLIAGAIPLTFILGSIGLYRQWEAPLRDVMTALSPPQQASDVAVVRVTNDDYKNLFHKRSPLDPAQLQRLIEAVAKGKPRVIGIDIDTSAEGFRGLTTSPEWPTVVWARDAAFSPRERKFYPHDVLGGREPESASGIVLLKLEADGAVRRYSRLYDTDAGLRPSLAWALVNEFYRGRPVPLKGSADELLINFSGDAKGSHRVRLSASQVLELSGEEAWQSDGILRDKIVLIGGDYAAQDEHDTPLGWMLGVEVLAQIVETELRGGGARPPGYPALVVIIALNGLAVWLLFDSFKLKKALLLCIPAVPSLALLSSLVAFQTPAQYAYFAPVLLLILFQRLYTYLTSSSRPD